MTKTSFDLAAFLAAAAIGIPLAAQAQDAPHAAEQREADDRVIAARCGTPAFEKSFYRQSRAAVAAGLVVKNRDPVQVEKSITAMRRSPFVLVATQADCTAELQRLAELQRSRAALVRRGGGRAQ